MLKENVKKGAIVILVFQFLCLSCLANPDMQLTAVDQGGAIVTDEIKYDIGIEPIDINFHLPFLNQSISTEKQNLFGKYRALESDTSYYVNIYAQRKESPIKNIVIKTPANYAQKIDGYDRNPFSNKVKFVLVTTTEAGNYDMSFEGVDVDANKIYLSTKIKVIDKNDFNTEYEKLVKGEMVSQNTLQANGAEKIAFPKEFESEKNKSQLFSLVGMLTGVGMVYGAYSGFYSPKSLADLFFLPLVMVAGGFGGSAVGARVDNQNYESTDVCWIKNLNKQDLIEFNGMIYVSNDVNVYPAYNSELSQGIIKKGEFRKILERKQEESSFWYKVKKQDTPIFY